MPPEIIFILIIFSGLCGFFISLHVRLTKMRGDVLFCPTDSDCDKVIHSSYSKTFGIANEELGLVYYFLITLITVMFIFFPVSNWLAFLFVFPASLLAFIFSIYLFYIQGVKIKEWCTLCILSGIFVTIILFSIFALFVQ